MAKTPQMKLLSSSQTAARIIRYLDASRAKTRMHTYEHFLRSLGVWEAMLRQVPMEPWLEACRGLERGLQPLCEALALLMLEASANYDDVLGAVYMEMGQNDKRFGQFFTPSPVAWMMAEMTLGDVQLPAPGGPPLRIYEPTCGSGVMLLSAAGVIESRWPGAIGRGQVEFYGMDLDAVCVAMCRLNLLLHGIGRAAQTIDELTSAQRRFIERLLSRPDPTGPERQALSDGQVGAGGISSSGEVVTADHRVVKMTASAGEQAADHLVLELSTSESIGEPLFPVSGRKFRMRPAAPRQKADLPDQQPAPDEPNPLLLPADETHFEHRR